MGVDSGIEFPIYIRIILRQGLPDFRGNEGFWKAYPPLKDLNISFQQMANPAWFKKDPTLAWYPLALSFMTKGASTDIDRTSIAKQFLTKVFSYLKTGPKPKNILFTQAM